MIYSGMKTRKKKPFLNMDERNKLMAIKIMAVMYFLTIFAMQMMVLYRQLALGQDIEQFEDFAVIMTVNTLFLVSALLYFGAIPVQRLKIKLILLIYVVFLLLGVAFTFLKYNLLGDNPLSFIQLLEKVGIVAAILGIMMGFFILFSWLGKRRLEKEIE